MATTTTSSHQPESKRHTQNIAAIAAQRKAKQHHRELMQELETPQPNHGNHFNSDSMILTSSRLNEHHGDNEDHRMVLEKRNSVLTDGSSNVYGGGGANKIKKQVKIRDIVQYKLPDDKFYSEEMVISLGINFGCHPELRTGTKSGHRSQSLTDDWD